MADTDRSPIAITATDLEPRRSSSYPAPFAERVAGRAKRALGAVFGLQNFGVNLTELQPGAMSSVRHAHGKQDEFIYVLEGHPTLRTNAGETLLGPGMCAGFPAGRGDAHHLVNLNDEVVRYLEIGDRTPGDEVVYPDDDLEARFVEGSWRFFHKDGRPY